MNNREAVELLREMSKNCLKGKEYDDAKRGQKHLALEKAIMIMEMVMKEEEATRNISDDVHTCGECFFCESVTEYSAKRVCEFNKNIIDYMNIACGDFKGKDESNALRKI